MANENLKSGKDARPRQRNWVGAAIVAPGDALGARRRRRTTFHVWRSSKTRSLYLITGTEKLEELVLPPGVRSMGWIEFKSFPETGLPRVGMSEAEAKRDIAKYGFHLRRITLNTTERVGPPFDMTRRKPKASAA